VRTLAVRGVRVRREPGGGRIVELHVINRGNVTESLRRDDVRLVLRRGVAESRVRADARDLRPRTGGVVQFRYRGRLVGWVTATARIAAELGRPAVSRSFRVKL
jgi:hypothetical protein